MISQGFSGCAERNNLKTAISITLVAGLLISASLAAENLHDQFPEASVEQGAYLAKAGNCYACHTAHEERPYAGGVAFNTPFGLLYSTNITADQTTGIGAWGFDDFRKAMREGVRPNGEHLYPAFPYTDFAQIRDEDLASLYLYFMSVDPIEGAAQENALAFPYDRRELLAPWKFLFHDAQTFEPNTARSDEWNRGAYLVEALGHCGACHTPRNALGAERVDWALSGAVVQDKVKLGFYRDWAATNLTNSPRGLASWSEDDIVAYLKEGQNDKSVVHGPMVEVVMHSTRHLSESDLHAMAVYLKAQEPIEQAIEILPSDEQLAAGELVYTVHCGSCHLPDGAGDSGLGVTLKQNPIVQADDPSSLINVILYGPHLPGPPFTVDRTTMKMFGKRLSDQEIAAVSSYLRVNFGNRAGAVDAAQVKRQR